MTFTRTACFDTSEPRKCGKVCFSKKTTGRRKKDATTYSTITLRVLGHAINLNTNFM